MTHAIRREDDWTPDSGPEAKVGSVVWPEMNSITSGGNWAAANPVNPVGGSGASDSSETVALSPAGRQD
jgi:hypothetical protein